MISKTVEIILYEWFSELIDYYKVLKEIEIDKDFFISECVIKLGKDFLLKFKEYDKKEKWQLVFTMSLIIFESYLSDDEKLNNIDEMIRLSDGAFNENECLICFYDLLKFIFYYKNIPKYLNV